MKLSAFCYFALATLVFAKPPAPPPAADPAPAANDATTTNEVPAVVELPPQEPVRRLELGGKDFAWDLQFLDPRDPKPAKERPQDVWKNSMPSTPRLVFPVETAAAWGTFRFWHHSDVACFTNGVPKQDAYVLPSQRLPKDAGLYGNVWLRHKETVPADWAGERLVVEWDGLENCDALLFVNREFAGTFYKPGGRVDVGEFVKTGAENEFLILLSSNGYQIPPKKNQAAYFSARVKPFMATLGPPTLVRYPAAFVDDVYARTILSDNRLAVDVSIASAAEREATLLVEVLDAKGAKVLMKKSVKCELPEGWSTQTVEFIWPKPNGWEPGRARQFKLRVRLAADGKVFAYPPFAFAFRELSRDGKDLFLNGHPLRLRPIGEDRISPDHPFEFYAALGFNAIEYANEPGSEKGPSIELLEERSAHGIGAIVTLDVLRKKELGDYATNRTARALIDRDLETKIRKIRNVPGILVCHLEAGQGEPRILDEERADPDLPNLLLARDLEPMLEKVRGLCPHILFGAFGDGAFGDFASAGAPSGLCPIQEREEALSRWASDGTWPLYVVSNSLPLQPTWFLGEVPYSTERLASVYGEEAYRKEPAEMRDDPTAAADPARHPLMARYLRDTLVRTTRAWRLAGISAGAFPFPAGVLTTNEAITATAVRSVNREFLGYIAGSPDPEDRSHVYRAGETIEKQIAFLLDRPGNTSFSAKWSAKFDDGESIADGRIQKKCKGFTPAFAPISFVAPRIKEVRRAELRVIFYDAYGKEIFRDAVRFEIYPELKTTWYADRQFALIDPNGAEETFFRHMEFIRYKKVDSLADIGKARLIVIGNGALSSIQMKDLSPLLNDGFKVMVLGQRAEEWAKSGLEVADLFPRALFLRDTGNKSYANLVPDTIRDWKGQPGTPGARRTPEGVESGAILFDEKTGQALRPRGSHRHAPAGLLLRTPARIGFNPQIEGGDDLAYSALLTYTTGFGSITFCTLDLEDRTAYDPAVLDTAAAVFKDFLGEPVVPHNRTIRTLGGFDGTGIVEAVGGVSQKAGEEFGNADLILVGPDSKVDWETIQNASSHGANILVIRNPELAESAGFTVGAEKKTTYIECSHAGGVLRGIGQALMRWRIPIAYRPLENAPKGFKLDGDGLIASYKTETSRVVFCQLDPFGFEQAANAESDKTKKKILQKLAPICREHAVAFYARLFTNLGAQPSEASDATFFRSAGEASWKKTNFYKTGNR